MMFDVADAHVEFGGIQRVPRFGRPLDLDVGLARELGVDAQVGDTPGLEGAVRRGEEVLADEADLTGRGRDLGLAVRSSRAARLSAKTSSRRKTPEGGDAVDAGQSVPSLSRSPSTSCAAIARMRSKFWGSKP